MISKTLSIIFVLIAANAVIYSTGMGIGTFVPLLPSEEEKGICQDKAKSEGMEYKNTIKEYGKTCYIKCTFKNDKPLDLNSPKDTPCCDIGGGLATGKCDGKGACESFLLNIKE